MSAIECTCDDPSFGHVGRPNCVITQGALAFPMFSPKTRTNGLRNYLPTNAASLLIFLADYGIGFADINTALNPSPALTADSEVTIQHIVDWRLSTYAPVLDRLYPSLRVENATFPRTETVFEAAPSGRKTKIEGVGGIRTWSMELWGKDAAHGVARAHKKFGCHDLDVYYVDVAGVNWGIQDIEGDGKQRGYEMDTATFDQFMEYATDTTAQKIMLSFDLDRLECEEKSWAITADEYGKKFTTIRPLIQGIIAHDAAGSTLVAASPIIIKVTLSASFGTAGNKHDITGLLTGAFTLLDSLGAEQEAAGAWTSVVESPNGTYLLTTSSSPAAGTFTLVTKTTLYIVPNVNVIVA